jgi:hypothetical protein
LFYLKWFIKLNFLILSSFNFFIYHIWSLFFFIVTYFVLNPFLDWFFFNFDHRHFILFYFYIKFGLYFIKCYFFYFDKFFILKCFFSNFIL